MANYVVISVVLLVGCNVLDTDLEVYKDLNQSVLRNVEYYISNCSDANYNVKYDLYPKLVQLCDANVLTSCDYNAVSQRVDNAIGSSYAHRIYILPANANCDFYGLAQIGCDTNCKIWVLRDAYKSNQVYLHELGHNLGFYHSVNVSEYKDTTDAMSYCCSDICFNPVNNNILNWSLPIDRVFMNDKIFHGFISYETKWNNRYILMDNVLFISLFDNSLIIYSKRNADRNQSFVEGTISEINSCELFSLGAMYKICITENTEYGVNFTIKKI